MTTDFNGLPLSAKGAEEVEKAMETMLQNAAVKGSMELAPVIVELESGASLADIITRMNALIRAYNLLRRRVG